MAQFHPMEVVQVFREKNQFAEDMAASLLTFVKDYRRGDVLQLTDIEQLTGVNRYTGAWTLIILKFRRRLLRDRRIALWPVISIGYRFCTHDEQLNLLAERRQKRAARQLTRALTEVGALPNGELTMHQRRVKAFREQSIEQERRSLRKAAREQRILSKPTETLPIPKGRPGVILD